MKHFSAPFLSSLLLASACLSPSPFAALAGTWPTYHGSPSLEGFAATELPEKPALLWRFRTGGYPSGTPVAGEGLIFLATDKGEVFALDGKGVKAWSTFPARAAGLKGEERGNLFLAPPLFAASTVLIGSRSGDLYALHASSGKLKWHHFVGSPIFGTANLAGGQDRDRPGVVVISQPDGVIHRIALATGEAEARSAPTNRCDGSASVGGGLVVYGNCDAALHVFSARSLEETARIDLRPEGEVFAGVALSDGTAYVGDRSGRLYAVDPAAGRILWVNEEATEDVSTTPAVHGKLVVYTSDDGAVSALDRATGDRLWRFESSGRPTAAVLSADGKVVFGADGRLHLLDGRTGRELWSQEVSDEITSPAVFDGMIVVAGDDGYVSAFGAKR